MDRKSWEELKNSEIFRLKKHQCAKCHYYSTLNKGAYRTNATCDYILIEGHSRKCDPRDCIVKGRFKPKNRKKNPKMPGVRL